MSDYDPHIVAVKDNEGTWKIFEETNEDAARKCFFTFRDEEMPKVILAKVIRKSVGRQQQNI